MPDMDEILSHLGCDLRTTATVLDNRYALFTMLVAASATTDSTFQSNARIAIAVS